MQEFLSMEEVEGRLKRLSKFALRQVAGAVGVKAVSKYTAVQLRQVVLGVAKGEVEQVTEKKRKFNPETMMFNGDIAMSVLNLREQNKN